MPEVGNWSQALIRGLKRNLDNALFSLEPRELEKQSSYRKHCFGIIMFSFNVSLFAYIGKRCENKISLPGSKNVS